MSLQFSIAQLRHLYFLMLNRCVKDTAEAARDLLGPAIVAFECELDRQSQARLEEKIAELRETLIQVDYALGRATTFLPTDREVKRKARLLVTKTLAATSPVALPPPGMRNMT